MYKYNTDTEEKLCDAIYWYLYTCAHSTIQNIVTDLHFIVHYAAFKSIKLYEYDEISF